MGLINDPIKSFKDQAYKIWDVKDFGERLAFSRTGIFISFVYYFMFLNILYILVILAVNDLFVLANHYASGQAWYLEMLEDLFFETLILQMILVFFWTSPNVVKKTMLVWKAYSSKERGFMDWTEFKIKKKFPKFKTRTQRTRERLEKPKKETRIGKWLLALPRYQRLMIRYSISISYVTFMILVTTSMLMPDLFWFIITGEEVEKPAPTNQISLEQELENQPIPKIPDNRPPSTIYDIFISRSDSVIP